MLGRGKRCLHLLQRTLAEVQLVDVMLREATELGLGIELHEAGGGLQLAKHQLDEGGLADTVGANQGNTRPQVNALVQFLQKRLGTVAKADVGQLCQEAG